MELADPFERRRKGPDLEMAGSFVEIQNYGAVTDELGSGHELHAATPRGGGISATAKLTLSLSWSVGKLVCLPTR